MPHADIRLWNRGLAPAEPRTFFSLTVSWQHSIPAFSIVSDRHIADMLAPRVWHVYVVGLDAPSNGI